MKKLIRCRNCGKMVGSNSKRCKHCGTLLRLSWISILIIIFFVLFIVIFFLIGFMQSG